MHSTPGLQKSKHSLADIRFEPRDAEIFRIPDLKTRLATLQNYFFPRLESLLRLTIDKIQEIYGVNPYETMTFAYRPSHRKDASTNKDYKEVYIALCGKRGSTPLTIKKRDGSPFVDSVTYLTYTVYPEGGMRVVLLPYRQRVDYDFVSRLADLYRQNLEFLNPIMAICRIGYSNAAHFAGPEKALSLNERSGEHELAVWLSSPYRHFPLDSEMLIESLVVTFAALYPLLEAGVNIAQGVKPRLAEHLHRFRDWSRSSMEGNNTKNPDATQEDLMSPELPELDSYSFIRAGLWWTVLARDKWTCCSCGRSAKQDGIILQVDHIVPRSRGGKDDPSNLQTLCRKCNIGKSDRDQTDLRAT